jgi:phospholipid transport system transporter-binding protein
MITDVSIQVESSQIKLSGQIRMHNAPAWEKALVNALHEIKEPAVKVQLIGISEVDSSIVALLLSWLRHAQSLGITISYFDIPEAIQSIAQLYGVWGLLPVLSKGN